MTGLDAGGGSSSAGSYLPSQTLTEYLHSVATLHPRLRGVLDFHRPGAPEALDVLAATTSEFDSDQTGRGDSYRRAQRDPLVRWTGMYALLGLAAPDGSGEASMVLDVLGGDGTIARAVGQTAELGAKLMIVTGDRSGHMVDQALAQGLPAVRQAADFLFLRDDSMDAVLLAYGTHHIAPAERARAVAEAARVVRAGGRIVVHDFDAASPMAEFFARTVHPNAPGGHSYEHFSRPELVALFTAADLPVRILDLYDPLSVRSDTEHGARGRMCEYIGDMYGIGALWRRLGPEAAWRAVEEYFDHTEYLAGLGAGLAVPARPVVHLVDDQFVAEVPRMAIVAVAEKVLP